MSKGLRIGSMLLLAGALGIGVLSATAVQGQVIHPDQMVGGLSLQGDPADADNARESDSRSAISY
jgi:hypothetical protein